MNPNTNALAATPRDTYNLLELPWSVDRMTKRAEPESLADIANLLTGEQIANALKIHRRTLQRWVRDGHFPLPDRVIQRYPRWEPETVRNWLKTN